jgi:hypothetical protein
MKKKISKRNLKRVNQLEEAKDKIGDAIDLIRRAVKGTDSENSCESYIIGHLKGWMNGDNPLDDTAIPALIDHILNPDEED